jgi:CheY-like chemotaxis protein
MNFPKKVFLIDDDEEERYILSAALNECCEGVELRYEKNAKATLARLANDGDAVPDIVFIDWRMPLVSGKEVLTSLRKLPRYTQIPIVIFTGIVDPVFLEEAKALGATFLMQKPFDFADLCLKLKYLFPLDWRQTKQAGQQI